MLRAGSLQTLCVGSASGAGVPHSGSVGGSDSCHILEVRVPSGPVSPVPLPLAGDPSLPCPHVVVCRLALFSGHQSPDVGVLAL